MGILIDEDELLKAMDTWDKFGYLAHTGLIRLGKEQKYFVQYVRYEDMVKAVNGMPIVEAIPKADYETRLKADMVAILADLQQEIEENVLANDPNTLLPFLQARETCVAVIQQKINALKKEYIDE